MKRLLTTLALALVVLAGFGAGTSAAYISGYTQPGEWFSPGEAYGSAYDHACSRWFDNHFAKSAGGWGLITYIDTGGGWNYTKQGYGSISRLLSNDNWTKKMHCKNNSGQTYQGGCFGDSKAYQCA